MPRQVEVRCLTGADVEQYRRIRLSTLATDPDSFGSTYEEQAAQPITFFADRLAGATVFAACTPERIVGVAHLRQVSGQKQAHKGTVQGFFVEPDWRHRGIGAALMTALIDHARDRVEQLTLSVIQGNRDAIGLYRRFGFTIYGIEPRARKLANGYVDEVLMVLRLSKD